MDQNEDSNDLLVQAIHRGAMFHIRIIDPSRAISSVRCRNVHQVGHCVDMALMSIGQ
jgi:hypothetical protein